ncbi:MAG: TonB-dependent receptor [Gammaproteobacteria bacterium]|nr:TonB-dependent receptor [Gammaproteobacteria bacterium]
MLFSRLRCGGVARTVFVGTLLSGTAAAAEDSAEEENRAEEDEGPVELIIVTAEKREQPLQDVPLAVSSFGSEDLQRLVVNETVDIGKYVPGLEFYSTTGGNNRGVGYVRGIGQWDPHPANSSRVPMYLDGVYVGNQTGLNGTLHDIERVEVLRGPQGTLYGRNTIGGAINVISRKPTNEPGALIEVRGGEQGYFETRGHLNGPLAGEALAGRLTFQRAVRDALVKNAYEPGDDSENLDRWSMRASLRWLPPDSELVADFVFEHIEFDEADSADRLGAVLNSGWVARGFLPRTVELGPSRPGDPFFNSDRAPNGSPFHSDLTVDFHALSVGWDVTPDVVLKSITGWRVMDMANMNDVDGTEARVFSAGTHVTHEQIYQELQSVGTAFGGALDYTAGATFFNEKFETDQDNFFLASPVNRGRRVDGDNDALGVYGQASLHASPRLTLTTGARYTEETKKHFVELFTNGDTGDFRTDFDNFSPMFRANWNWSDSVMTYLGWSRGYQAGGFPARPPATSRAFLVPYDEEIVSAWDAGVKAQFLDRRVQLNVAGYYYDHKDQQISNYIAAANGFTIDNAGRSRIRGIEAELRASPTHSLDLMVNAAWNKGKFLQYTQTDPVTGRDVDVSEARVHIRSPRRMFSGSARYSFPVTAASELSATLSFRYTSAQYSNANPNAPAVRSYSPNSRTLWDLRLQLDDALGREGMWFAFVGQNTSDKEHITFGIDVSSLGWTMARWGPPRLFWAEFGMRFGQAR